MTVAALGSVLFCLAGGWVTVLHQLLPVEESAVCGTWTTSAGASLVLRSDNSFTADRIPELADGGYVSGVGRWSLSSEALHPTIVHLSLSGTRVGYGIAAQRGVLGQLELHITIGDPDELKYLEFERKADCV